MGDIPVFSNDGISQEIDFLLAVFGATAGRGFGFGDGGAGLGFLSLSAHFGTAKSPRKGSRSCMNERNLLQ